MRILIFSLAYYPVVGGAEVAIKEITDRLPDIEFDMVTLRLDKSHPRFERVGNVNVYRIGGGFGYLSKILFIPDAAAFAVAMHRRRRYDMFWAMMTYMTWPIVLARMLGNRTPYAITLQDGDPFKQVFGRWYIRPFRPLLASGFRHAAVIQAISNFLAEWPRRMGYTGRVEMIPNGVPVDDFGRSFLAEELEKARRRIGKQEGDIILASSSRLVEKNGLDDVVRALPLLPANIKFYNWGVGPDKDKLEALARKLGVSDRVRLFPHDPKTLPLDFQASDIFIRPSLSEGQGISFLEGMAAGLPIIGTPVGGIPDFLKDGETGVFCRPRDPQSIAAAVERLVDDQALCRRLSENGKKLVLEKYDWELIAGEMKKRVFYSTVPQ